MIAATVSLATLRSVYKVYYYVTHNTGQKWGEPHWEGEGMLVQGGRPDSSAQWHR